MGISLQQLQDAAVATVAGCEHEEVLLNPDAVAVKWYKCRLCGRTRREEIRKEIW